MRIIENTLEATCEQWRDPGDYPSGAGAGPLPPGPKCWLLEGDVVVEYGETLNRDDALELATEYADRAVPSPITSVVWDLTPLPSRRIRLYPTDWSVKQCS